MDKTIVVEKKEPFHEIFQRNWTICVLLLQKHFKQITDRNLDVLVVHALEKSIQSFRSLLRFLEKSSWIIQLENIGHVSNRLLMDNIQLRRLFIYLETWFFCEMEHSKMLCEWRKLFKCTVSAVEKRDKFFSSSQKRRGKSWSSLEKFWYLLKWIEYLCELFQCYTWFIFNQSWNGCSRIELLRRFDWNRHIISFTIQRLCWCNIVLPWGRIVFYRVFLQPFSF